MLTTVVSEICLTPKDVYMWQSTWYTDQISECFGYGGWSWKVPLTKPARLGTFDVSMLLRPWSMHPLGWLGHKISLGDYVSDFRQPQHLEIEMAKYLFRYFVDWWWGYGNPLSWERQTGLKIKPFRNTLVFPDAPNLKKRLYFCLYEDPLFFCSVQVRERQLPGHVWEYDVVSQYCV